MSHPLDRPVWNMLTTRHAGLAHGDGRAWRIDAAVGPFAAAADTTPDRLAALGALLPPGDELWLVEGERFPVPPALRLASEAPLDQMIADRIAPPAASVAIEPLGPADAGEMVALASLTRPGPFRAQTYRFGDFVGVRDGGRLVAMAGTRMRVPGFTEISGVCTHPDHRGRGYAAQLMRAVGAQIVGRGEAAFLHVYPSNVGAIDLYRALGFSRRRGLMLQVMVRA